MRLAVLEPALEALIDRALAEDVRTGDVTTAALVPPDRAGRAALVARSGTVACALDVARRCFERFDPQVAFLRRVAEGQAVPAGTVLAHVEGRAASLLTAERCALNILQRSCGIAAATRECVAIVAGTGCVLLDTRKTAPGLRVLDKLAVRTGGGQNHRMALDDLVLVKDNHVAIAGSLTDAVGRAVAASHGLRVEVEVDSLTQVEELLSLPRLPDWVLLDNFSPEQVRAAVLRISGAMKTEASGGIHRGNLLAYAEAGPDAISLGFITHSVTAADLALDIDA